jgi:hypothetical protein
MVWDPARIAPTTWPGALEFYRHIVDRNEDFRPLCQLVEHVGSRAYAASLAPATSGTALLVSRAASASRAPQALPGADFDWVRDALRVDVDLRGAVRFTWPQGSGAKAATFECVGTKVVGTFESFLRQATWIPS